MKQIPGKLCTQLRQTTALRCDCRNDRGIDERGALQVSAHLFFDLTRGFNQVDFRDRHDYRGTPR